MATWSVRASRDMADLTRWHGAAAVDSVRAPISRWADTVVGGQRQRQEFQGQLPFPVYAEAQNREILLVEHD